MGRTLTTKSSPEQDRVMTPGTLGLKIVYHFSPYGRILEPCIGDGVGFYNPLQHWASIEGFKGEVVRNLPKTTVDWMELDKERDFLCPVELSPYLAGEHYDWIITNPPFSKFSDFLEQSFRVADNVAFICQLPAVYFKKRLRLAKEYGFGIKEQIYIDTPKEFPQSGFQIACVHWQKGYDGPIHVTDWRK